MTRSLRIAMGVAAAVAAVAACLGIGVRSSYGGHAAVDEPQYLLTALSLWEDRSLDISDELADRRWRAYFDAELPVQTEVLNGGRQVSPHDPLLPLLLAVPMGLGGMVAAKITLGLLAGASAALTVWVAVRRLAVPPWLAGAGVAAAFASSPLAIYGQQAYPEMPAALAVLLAVAAGTGPLRRSALVVVAAAIVALPWLSVKYLPVAAAIAGLVLWRLHKQARSRTALTLAVVLAVAGLVYLGLHRLLWGGWTVYASGDHFVSTGEFSVVGVSPDYLGRSVRLLGLLVDRGYGLVAWQPAWLLAVAGVAALARRRPPGALLLLLPAGVGWAMATWVALTMRGFWSPGRQVVVILPLVLLAVLWWLAHVAGPRLRLLSAGLGAAGVITYLTLLIDGWAGQLTWVTGFQGVDNPLYALMRRVLPDYSTAGLGFWLGHGAWILLTATIAVAAWRQARPTSPASVPPQPGERTLTYA